MLTQISRKTQQIWLQKSKENNILVCCCPAQPWLQGLDVLFLHETIATTLAEKGHSVQLLFAFEYIILASASVATLLKYILSMVDSAMEGRWDGKGTYVFYLELLTDMLHLFVYCIFFVIVFTNYGLPLHLVSVKPVGVMVKHCDLCRQCTRLGCLQRQPKGLLHV